ncbi:LytR C-terminal domain-containing protein, partial [Arthrobacter sp. MDT1-48-3]
AVPTVPAADPNRLVLDGSTAPQLFAALRSSADLTSPATTGEEDSHTSGEEDTAPGGTVDSTMASSPVTVADGTAGSDVPATLVEALHTAGFKGAQSLPAPSTPLTAIYYSAGFADPATAVAAALGIPATTISTDETIYGVQVYLGTDARNGLGTLTAQDVTGTINQTADQVSCQDTNPFG